VAAAGDEVIKNLRFSPIRIQLYPSFKFFVSLLLDFQSVKMVRVCDDSINTKKMCVLNSDLKTSFRNNATQKCEPLCHWREF
jgi:hypothetical protein